MEGGGGRGEEVGTCESYISSYIGRYIEILYDKLDLVKKKKTEKIVHYALAIYIYSMREKLSCFLYVYNINNNTNRYKQIVTCDF